MWWTPPDEIWGANAFYASGYGGHPTFTVEEESDQPYLLHFERSFDANLLTCVPSWSTSRGRVIL